MVFERASGRSDQYRRLRSLFANGTYAFNSHLNMGLELSYWSTDYKDADTADSLRGQFAVVYKF